MLDVATAPLRWEEAGDSPIAVRDAFHGPCDADWQDGWHLADHVDGAEQGTISPLPGGEATFTSEVTVTAAETFLEIGAMTFGDGHRLRVTTVGSGYLGPSADPALRQGAVIWRVEEGEGQFAGASGLICANVLLRDNGQLVAHHLGLIFVPDSGSP